MNKPLALAAGLTLAAFAAPSLAQAQNAFTTEYVNMRAGPGLEYPVVFAVQPSQPLTSYGCLDDWSWCDVSIDGYRGWMVGDYISYYYGGSYVPVAVYGPRYHLPIISFNFGFYWDTYYRGRPWYRDRDRWSHYDWRRHAWNGPSNWNGRHDWDRWHGNDHWDGRRDNDRHDGRRDNDHRDGDRHDGRWDNNRRGAVQPYTAPGYGGQHRSQVDANRNDGRNDDGRNGRFGTNDPSQHSGVNSQHTPQYRGNAKTNVDAGADKPRFGKAVRPDVQHTDRAVQPKLQPKTDKVNGRPQIDNNRNVQRTMQNNERVNNKGGKDGNKGSKDKDRDDRS
jgi:uncharacterized protein YraI